MRFRVLACCAVAGLAHAQDFRPPTHKAIQEAIGKGAHWLREAQREDGSWGPCFPTGTYDGERFEGRKAAYPIGPTAFAVFALVKSGAGRSDPAVAKALRWLNGNAPQRSGDFDRCTSYESAAFVLMLTSLNDPPRKPGRDPPWSEPSESPGRRPRESRFRQTDWTWMRAHVEHLLDCRIPRGCWGYWARNRDGYQDISATQFALLALREAVRAGYPLELVDRDLWRTSAKALRHFQLPSGAFQYHRGESWSAGRTVAGVSSLLICQEQLHRAGYGVPSELKDSIAAGLKALDGMFDVSRNANGDHYHYCHLYGIERVGALSGRHELGDKAWYPRGAAFLLGEQDESGSWRDETCMDPKDVLGTCFALLFLSRATAPVTFSSGR